MRRLLAALRGCEEGVTGVEYALLASLVAMALASEWFNFGAAVEEHYEYIGTEYAVAQS